jgi:hypothetical protein
MKTFQQFKIVSLLLFIIVMLTLSADSSAQTPQFYNYNNGTVSNSFPFNLAGGKMIQTLVGPGEFNQPSGATAGNITKFYVFISSAYPLGPATYTSFNILFSQTAITTLPTGSLYTGTWDTVYKRASVSLTAAGGTWLQFTLDHPFAYNPAQSIVIQIEQCSSTQSTGYSLLHTNTVGFNRRTFSAGGCPFAYGGTSTYVTNCGVDISTVTICNLFAGNWCPLSAFPVMPQATYFNASAWLGDTLYVQTPTTAGAGATTIYRYTYGGTWTTGVPCLTAVAGASLTACNGKLYLIGGAAAVTTSGNTCQEYNPATGTWTAKAPLPVGTSAHGSAAWGDSVIFVVGGPYTGAATNLNVQYYRPASDTWGTITNSLPSGQGRRTFAFGISGNKLVMTCGYNTAYLKSTYVGTIGADASLITWTAGLDAPVSLSRPAGVGYSNNFFLSGGDTNGTAAKNTKVFIYNVSGNSWNVNAPILNNPNPVSNSMNGLTAKCFSDTVRLFQPGGYPVSAVASNIFLVTGCGGLITETGNTSNIPGNYSLKQNYPNPFNPVTKIDYALPKNGFVTLKVYDMLGREVVSLVNETKAAGNYSVDFNASSLTSGVYFYRLEVNSFVDTKKMMLVK